MGAPAGAAAAAPAAAAAAAADGTGGRHRPPGGWCASTGVGDGTNGRHAVGGDADVDGAARCSCVTGVGGGGRLSPRRPSAGGHSARSTGVVAVPAGAEAGPADGGGVVNADAAAAAVAAVTVVIDTAGGLITSSRAHEDGDWDGTLSASAPAAASSPLRRRVEFHRFLMLLSVRPGR